MTFDLVLEQFLDNSDFSKLRSSYPDCVNDYYDSSYLLSKEEYNKLPLNELGLLATEHNYSMYVAQSDNQMIVEFELYKSLRD